MSDPWVILNQLASEGLEEVTVELKFDGQPVLITDRAFELAESNAIPQDTPQELISQAEVAAKLSDLSADDIASIRAKAVEGEEWAQRIVQALTLRELVRFRAYARRVVAKMLRGDVKARKGAEAIFSLALQQGHPLQPRARVGAFLLRDALLAAQRPPPVAPAEPVADDLPSDPATGAAVPPPAAPVAECPCPHQGATA